MAAPLPVAEGRVTNIAGFAKRRPRPVYLLRTRWIGEENGWSCPLRWTWHCGLRRYRYRCLRCLPAWCCSRTKQRLKAPNRPAQGRIAFCSWDHTPSQHAQGQTVRIRHRIPYLPIVHKMRSRRYGKAEGWQNHFRNDRFLTLWVTSVP